MRKEVSTEQANACFFWVVLNRSMNWNEVSIHTTPNSYPKSATPTLQESGAIALEQFFGGQVPERRQVSDWTANGRTQPRIVERNESSGPGFSGEAGYWGGCGESGSGF
jgi:hypothetical protein